jgi:hypothetical protein
MIANFDAPRLGDFFRFSAAAQALIFFQRPDQAVDSGPPLAEDLYLLFHLANWSWGGAVWHHGNSSFMDPM